MLISSAPARKCDVDGALEGLHDGLALNIHNVGVHAKDICGWDNPMLILLVVVKAQSLPPERSDNDFLPTATTDSESFKIIIYSIIWALNW